MVRAPHSSGPPEVSEITELASCFSRSQESVNFHRKESVVLFRAFQQQAEVVTEVEPGRIRLTGEKAFADGFKDMVDRILQVKKGVAQGDRCCKFVAHFIAYAVEKAQPDGEEDTPSSRLVAVILKHLLKALPAKDKTVRYRACQLIAMMTSGLPELDDDIHRALIAALMDRARDKEATIRAQAVVALSRLQSTDEVSDDDDEETPFEVILDALEHDTSAEVRRVALHQIDPTPQMVPYLLKRARDIDASIRRNVFAVSFADLADPFAVLDSQQREQLIRSGLKDREPAVRKCASKLISSWADQAGGLLELLRHFNVFSGLIAQDMLKVLFEQRSDLLDNLEFGEDYWNDMTPESAFLIRALATYCDATKNETKLDEVLPVITALAFRLEMIFDELAQALAMQKKAEEDIARAASLEFVVKECLSLAMLMDYADENGRRKMFDLIRNMISHNMLPHSLIPHCLDVLLKLSTGERDFLQVVVEVVHNHRFDANVSGSAPDKSVHSGSDDEDDLIAEELTQRSRKEVQFSTQVIDPEKAPVHLRCLALVRALLERVLGALSDNAMFVGLVHELIVPAVRCKITEIREQGMLCLGLCSLLDRDMALDSFGLFVNQSQSAEGELKERVYEIVFDVLMLYGVDLLAERGHGSERVIEFLLHALQEEADIQAAAAVGIAKLMLSGQVTDVGVLTDLVLIYFAPETAGNEKLRQCLSFFFPVYSYSSPANQRRMQQIVMQTLDVLLDVYDDPETDKDSMIAPTQIALQMIDWTDPNKAVDVPGQAGDDQVHVSLAADLLKGVYKGKKKEERKLYCQHLSKLYLPETTGDVEIRALLTLIETIQEEKPLADAVSRTALNRFETNLRKSFAAQLEPMNEDQLAEFEDKMRAWQGVGDFLDEQRRARLNDDDEYEAADVKVKAPARRKTATKGKRPRAASVGSEVSVDDDQPRRSGRARKKVETVAEESEEEEESESD